MFYKKSWFNLYLFIHLIIIILILSDSYEIEISELELLIEKSKQQPPQHNYGCEILSGFFILSFLVVLVIVLITVNKYS